MRYKKDAFCVPSPQSQRWSRLGLANVQPFTTLHSMMLRSHSHGKWHVFHTAWALLGTAVLVLCWQNSQSIRNGVSFCEKDRRTSETALRLQRKYRKWHDALDLVTLSTSHCCLSPFVRARELVRRIYWAVCFVLRLLACMEDYIVTL